LRVIIGLAKPDAKTSVTQNTRLRRISRGEIGAKSTPRLTGLTRAHGFDAAFWRTAAISTGGAISAAALAPARSPDGSRRARSTPGAMQTAARGRPRGCCVLPGAAEAPDRSPAAASPPSAATS
jgi:hypothetical protein